MTEARTAILDAVRRHARRAAEAGGNGVDERLSNPRANLVPARGRLDAAACVDLFEAEALAVGTRVRRVDGAADVPAAVADILRHHNLSGEVRVAPDPAVADLPWDTVPHLSVSRGRARGEDAVSVTPAYGAVAETGTLVLRSGPDHPATLNFLPRIHVAVLARSAIAGTYEDVWRRLRADAGGDNPMPRALNLVTGPSRTADIEQELLMGAHGPQHLHVLIVPDT